jgi:trehalose synthase
MVQLTTVQVPRRPVADLEGIVGAERFDALLTAAAEFRTRFEGLTVWNVSSTATGGGVAEMLQSLVGYVRDLRIGIQWRVIAGDADFFALTKRLHNHIHGQPGDGGTFGSTDDARYTAVALANADALCAEVAAGDLVLLHDPQTAGMVTPLVRAGARVVWRCHIGTDHHNELTQAAWGFLRPHLSAAHGFVFSRREYVPDWLPASTTWIIPPSIDPFAAKNQPLDAATVRAILARIGVLDGSVGGSTASFVRRDGTAGQVSRTAAVVADRLPGPDEDIVLQVSRWDGLKDMPGVMRGFTEHVAPGGPGYLILAGPAVDDVSDDPEGATVYAGCLARWQGLPAAVRARVALVTLPLHDVDENAAMVNALQRHATVIAQKSLAEGFGLTVAEGMWKARAVVGSAVGGIRDQIADGTGVLLSDAADLNTFGAAVRSLLDQPQLAQQMGDAAHRHVRTHFLGDVHLIRYAHLFAVLAGAQNNLRL